MWFDTLLEREPHKFDVLFETYTTYLEGTLRFVDSDVQDGPAGVPCSFAQFFGIAGDGTERPEVWKSGVAGGVLATGGPQGTLLSSAGNQTRGASGLSSGLSGEAFGINGDWRGLRGPNYLRNQANRMKQKIRKNERRAAQGFFSACDEGVQDSLRETRAKLLVAENKRKLIEEERKIKKLESPMQILEDAMAMVRFSERAARSAGDSKVAGWAATLSETCSESIARSAPSSVPSLDSIGSGGSARVVAARKRTAENKAKALSFDDKPPNPVESRALREGVLSKTALLDARKRAGRLITLDDFLRPSFPFKIDYEQKVSLYEAAGRDFGNEY